MADLGSYPSGFPGDRLSDTTSFATRFVAATLAGWAALALQIYLALPFLADDTLISLRYSQRFLDGQGLTFTDGEWVEGYTNLLLVLTTAGLGALGLDLVTAARLICAFGAFGAVAAVAAHGARFGLASSVLGAVLLAASPGLGVWVSGGLEQPLLVGLVCGGAGAAFGRSGR